MEARASQPYTYQYNSTAAKSLLGRRRAERDAAFFIPSLRPGMALLDCGCGPGTITVGLAEVVAPGYVLGVDIEEEPLNIGRIFAAQRAVHNIEFVKGDVCDLAIPGQSFDAVFTNGVLYHLRKPDRALAEIHRVLKPGGIIGVRNCFRSGDVYAPSDPWLNRGREILSEVMVRTGEHPDFGGHQALSLRQAGFNDIHISASYDVYRTTEELSSFQRKFFSDEMVSFIKEETIATLDELERIEEAFSVWNENPDRFVAMARFEAIGCKKSEG